MCEHCIKYEFVCEKCGSVLHPEYSGLVPFRVLRREIKNLLWTSQSEDFVWILLFEGRPVKVGHGSLMKLNNETRPNANYIRFDSVFIYYCGELRNEFACRLMGEIPGLVNRRGVSNSVYKTQKEMRWRVQPSASVKSMVLDTPDFEIAGIGYWDIRKLAQYGVS